MNDFIHIITLPAQPKKLAAVALRANPLVAAAIAFALRWLFYTAMVATTGAILSEPYGTFDQYLARMWDNPLRIMFVGAFFSIVFGPVVIGAIWLKDRRARAFCNGINLIAVLMFPLCMIWAVFYMLSSMDRDIMGGSPFPGGPIVHVLGSCWVAPLLFAIWLAMLTWLSHRLWTGPELDPNLCRNCSYDIRASRDAGSNTCPECGEKIMPFVP